MWWCSPSNQAADPCVETSLGVPITGDQILQNTKDSLKAGGVSLVQTNSTNAKGVLTVSNSAGGSFQKYSGLLAGATGRGALVSLGGCAVGPIAVGIPPTVVGGLDAGTLTFTGPAGPAVPLPIELGIKGMYGAILAAGGIPSSGGNFHLHGLGRSGCGFLYFHRHCGALIVQWSNRIRQSVEVKEPTSTPPEPVKVKVPPEDGIPPAARSRPYMPLIRAR